MSVCPKSSPLNKSGRSVALDSAYEKTVADVEPGAVPAAAEAAEGLDRDFGVL
jgi:hypothetical protein